jgi:hypothetical protein
LSAPQVVEIKTAGIAIHTEFQKNGCKPLQSTPVQAVDQAWPQAEKFKLAGRLSKLPLRISSASLSEVMTITYKGAKKKAAPMSKVPIKAQRAKT